MYVLSRLFLRSLAVWMGAAVILTGCLVELDTTGDSGIDSGTSEDATVDADTDTDTGALDASDASGIQDGGGDPVVQVASGFKATCARLASGGVTCWGDGRFGQLGNGSWETSTTPVAVTGVSDARDLAVGPFHACVVGASGGVSCWGWNDEGQLGNGIVVDSALPVDVIGLQDASQVAVGGRAYNGSSCAVHSGGSVSCWGENEMGQLGDGTTDDSEVPVTVIGITDAEEVAVGASFACARRVGGQVMCWGDNDEGQLGAGSSVASSSVGLDVTGVDDAQSLVVGDEHACVVRGSGALACWGANHEGQLGDSTWIDRNEPIHAQPTFQFTSVGLSSYSTCGRSLAGQVLCWGYGRYGQHGDGAWETRRFPVEADVPAEVLRISGGMNHLCAVTSEASVVCWGSNDFGQLGTQERSSTIVPESVQGGLTATAIAAGERFSCAVTTGGAVQCWGANGYGQLGDSTFVDRRAPATVVGIDGNALSAQDVDAMVGHACARLSDSTLRCWGRNDDGQLGDGTTANRNLPVEPQGVGATSHYAVGGYHTCAVSPGGGVQCWGYNSYGQLGDSTTEGRTLPVAVAGLTDVSAIFAGDDHTCVIRSAGTDRVLCWGRNDYGLLGDGTFVESHTPVPVVGVADASVLALGRYHSCALLLDGTVACWGYNGNRQLAVMTPARSEVPLAVGGLAGVVDLSAGEYHTCATLDTGRIRCWGSNVHRQCGSEMDHFATDSPLEVNDLLDAIAVDAGEVHTCALRSSGEVVCWGSNPQGELGTLETGTDQPTPLQVLGLP